MVENDASVVAIGKRLRFVRKKANLNRDELAKLAKVGRTTISYWENASDDEYSQMTPRSMAKIINALKEKGVICTERWLKSGIGPEPRYVDEANYTSNPSLTDNKTIEKSALSAQLIANLNEEIKQFTSLGDFVVITKVDTNSMYPALEKGDIVGGIWQSGLGIETEKICIIELNEKLQIRRIKPGTERGLFHVSFLTYDTYQNEPFEIKDVFLENVAPIIRVWR